MNTLRVQTMVHQVLTSLSRDLMTHRRSFTASLKSLKCTRLQIWTYNALSSTIAIQTPTKFTPLSSDCCQVWLKPLNGKSSSTASLFQMVLAKKSLQTGNSLVFRGGAKLSSQTQTASRCKSASWITGLTGTWKLISTPLLTITLCSRL